jgi:glycosyltransferase involved in cell wall biosynthesis
VEEGGQSGQYFDILSSNRALRMRECVVNLSRDVTPESGLKMKIGIYARGLDGIGGVKQYIEAMCRALINAVSDTDQLHIFHNLRTPCFDADKPNVFEVLLKSKNRLRCDLIEAPKAINARDLDVVWFTKYVVPFGIEAKTLATVHDLAYYMPELGAYSLADTLYMRVMIRNSVRRADHIIAVSEHTKGDLIERLAIPCERVTVIPEAADRRYWLPVDAERFRTWKKKRGMPDEFILFTGGISPRKNLLRLIQAFEQATSRIPHHKLVLTGGKGWQNSAVLSAIEKNRDVIRLGFVPDDEMPLLYAAADLFVYPSLYEGFGLPILEAQACGCPVLCSSNSSLPEVAGDGVRYVDPLDIAGVGDAIASILADRKEQRRLIEKGRQNAQRFSWERAAIQLLNVMAHLNSPQSTRL